MLNRRDSNGRSAAKNSARARMGSGVSVVAGLIAVTVLTVLVIAALPSESSPGAALPAPSSGAPHEEPDAITESEAQSIAGDHVVPDASYVSSTSGRFGDLYTNPRAVIEPTLSNRTVWAVKFSSIFDICPPDGSVCDRRPGTTTVYLDYYTGEWLRTSAFSPSS